MHRNFVIAIAVVAFLALVAVASVNSAPPPRTAVAVCHWTKADLNYFLKHPGVPITRKMCEQPVNKSRIRDFVRANCVPKVGRPITDQRRDWVCPIPPPHK